MSNELVVGVFYNISTNMRRFFSAYINEKTSYEKYGDLGELTEDLCNRVDARWEKLSDDEKQRVDDILKKHTLDEVMESLNIKGVS